MLGLWLRDMIALGTSGSPDPGACQWRTGGRVSIRMDKRYQVFVSSTYTDLPDARQAVLMTLLTMDCVPAGMEMFGAVDEEQFEFIKRVIDDSDYYVLIIGGRYGTEALDGRSYTEKE